MVEDVLYAALVSVGTLKPNRSEESFPAAYALLHQASGKAYVGSTHNLYLRMQQHRFHLKEGDHKNRHLQEAYNQSPELSVRYTKTTSKADAVAIEQQLLNDLFPSGKLFNISPDATFANKGVPVSEERKEELRQRTVNQFSTQEARDRQSQLSKEKWQDPEYRAKQESRVTPNDVRSEISNTVTALWQDEQYRRNVLKGQKKRRIPVVIHGITYSCRSEAATSLGLTRSQIEYQLLKAKGYYNGKS